MQNKGKQQFTYLSSIEAIHTGVKYTDIMLNTLCVQFTIAPISDGWDTSK